MSGGDRRRAGGSGAGATWVADGCASWIVDTVVAIPLLAVAIVTAAVTGAPFWLCLVVAGALAWSIGWVRRAMRPRSSRPDRSEPEI